MYIFGVYQTFFLGLLGQEREEERTWGLSNAIGSKALHNKTYYNAPVVKVTWQAYKNVRSPLALILVSYNENRSTEVCVFDCELACPR